MVKTGSKWYNSGENFTIFTLISPSFVWFKILKIFEYFENSMNSFNFSDNSSLLRFWDKKKTLWLNNDNKEQYTIYRRRERGWERYGANVIRFPAQRRDEEIEQLFFPFLCFSLSFASLFQLKDFSCGKCEMSFRLRCSPKPENTVNDFIHNNIEYYRIPTSSSRTIDIHKQTIIHPILSQQMHLAVRPHSARYSSLAGCDDLRVDCADILGCFSIPIYSNHSWWLSSCWSRIIFLFLFSVGQCN